MHQWVSRVTAAGAIICATTASAQQSGSALKTSPHLRIDSTNGLIGKVSWVTVSPSGVIAVANMDERTVQFFSPLGKRLGAFVGAANGMYSMDAVHAWVGDTLVVRDPAGQAVISINPDLVTVRSSPQPGWDGKRATRPPPPPDRIDGGIQMLITPGALTQEAIFPDGSMLAKADSANLPADVWAHRAPNAYALVVISQHGAFERLVTWVPYDECARSYTFGGVVTGVSSALCPHLLRNVFSDGRPVAMVMTDTHGPDSATYRVTVVGLNGDTIFARRFPYSPVRLSVHDSAYEVDGPVKYFSTKYPDQVDVIRTTILRSPPASEYAPLTSVTVGRDGTVWIAETTRGPVPATERRWIVLAPNGNPLGVVALPMNVTLQDADRSTIWAVEAEPGADAMVNGMPPRARSGAVVTYKVVFGSGVP